MLFPLDAENVQTQKDRLSVHWVWLTRREPKRRADGKTGATGGGRLTCSYRSVRKHVKCISGRMRTEHDREHQRISETYSCESGVEF
jgi:hypothetical protein